jgi:hypothetical protein
MSILADVQPGAPAVKANDYEYGGFGVEVLKSGQMLPSDNVTRRQCG